MSEAWEAKVPVIGQWQPAERRKASIGSTVAAVALVLFAVAALLMGGSQLELFLLVILVLVLLVAVFQALVVVTGKAQAPLGDGGAGAADWQQAYAPLPPAGEAAAAPQVTLKCSSCGTVFDVADTGERPLRHTCPGCGTVGELTEADLGPPPSAAAEETAVAGEMAPEAPAEAITLKCGHCGTVFDVTDTGERPLRHTCPGCGSEGVLREEDLGPAPAPAPRARGGARAATKTVKTLKLRCKNCSTVFTLRDTGERPLYHECPGCKATGVLR